MKYSFTPLLITTVIILTSLSECWNPFTGYRHAPISAEVNGVLYYSPSHPNFPHYVWAYYDGKTFDAGRMLYSEKGDSVFLKIWIERDTILSNIPYTDVPIFFSPFSTESIQNTCIEFSHIDIEQIAGKFRFDVINPETGEHCCKIRNGTFDLPYR